MKKLLLTGIAALLLATGAMADPANQSNRRTAHSNWLCEGDVEIGIEKLATDLEQVTITAYTRRYNKTGDEVGPRGSVIHRPGDTLKWARGSAQKWSNMADFNKRRRWRGPALGGRLQRAARFCFTAHDGEATTAQLTEWLRPELAGRRPLLWQRCNNLTALRSIGARRVRREGRQWVWQLREE